jgi:hypothetical protein
MNKFGITIYPLDETALTDKFVVIKEEAMRLSSLPGFIRKVVYDHGEFVDTVIPGVITGHSGYGHWERKNIEGWVLDKDAEKVIMWEKLKS